MAIIEELGLQATIVINNETAPEYPDTEQSVTEEFGPNTQKSHSYVRCVEGAEFAIKFSIKDPSSKVRQWLAEKDHAIRISVLIDGGRLKTSKFITQEYPRITITGVTDTANGSLRKFCFTAISTVDDDSQSRVAKDTQIAKDLGEIHVKAWRVVMTETIPKPNGPTQQSPLEGTIAEKALKGRAISHGTTLAPAVATRPHHHRHHDWEDLKNAPLAVFYFKYRSTEDLQKEMIIPRPRVPSPEAENGEDNDFRNLSKEDIERLARERHAELKKRKGSTAIKQENEDSVARPQRSYKYARTADGKKAIDLTQEDDDE